jgi:DNA-binding CsgD family transcriptional regulator
MDGNPARCISDMLLAAGGAELPGACPLTRATWYEILVRAELAQDHRAEALHWADRAAAAAATVGVPGQIGIAQLSRAEVLLAERDAAAGAERATAAAAAFTGCGDLLRAGRARLLAGRALTEAGDHDVAARQLEAARSLFAKVGASRLGAETGRRLRRLGGRIPAPQPRLPAPAGLPGLTARERDVASLVARGYSNRRIAEELMLSVRTVTTHISHIFAKLGVSSRAAIAAAWAHSSSWADGLSFQNL